MKKPLVSLPVIGRLPRYYRVVNALYHENCVRISSKTLADRLGLTASQIRQDFSCFGGFGQQGYGYNVKSLREEIREILGLNEQHTAILLGCGHLGHALLNNFDFSDCGFFMLASFDADASLAGQLVGGTPVMQLDDLPGFVAQDLPDIAVLCVPPGVAQETAEQLVQLGIRGIWNFTNIELSLPAGIHQENVNFSDTLLTLSYKLKQNCAPC